MLGFLFGGLCLVGLVRTLRRGGPPNFRRRWQRRVGRLWLHDLFERIDATPAQERAIVAAVEDIQSKAKGWRDQFLKSREDIARALRSDVFDEGAVFAAYAAHDSVIAEARETIVTTLRTFHEILDAKQRAVLADKLEGRFGFGPMGFRHHHHHGGPYRSHCHA